VSTLIRVSVDVIPRSGKRPGGFVALAARVCRSGSLRTTTATGSPSDLPRYLWFILFQYLIGILLYAREARRNFEQARIQLRIGERRDLNRHLH